MTIFTWLKEWAYFRPIVSIVSTLKLPKFDKEVELLLDSCPPPFDFTEAGNKTVEEIDRAILTMEKN